MQEHDIQRLKEIMLYVLDKTGGTDVYHLMKILYFAEQKHLAQWGTRMLPDEFFALEYGPVPSAAYDLVKTKTPEIKYANDDASDILLASRKPDMNYLSAADIEALDLSIGENLQLTFNQLCKKSHHKAWSEAFHRKNGNRKMDIMSIAAESGANQDMLDYIADELETEKMLL